MTINKKFDMKLIGLINLFENFTNAAVKDAFLSEDDTIVFIVNEGDAGKAIGKHGVNIKNVSRIIKKKIKIIEYNNDAREFVKNIIDPIKADDIFLEDRKLKIKSRDVAIRGKLIGRNRSNINEINKIVKKYFDVDVVVS